MSSQHRATRAAIALAGGLVLASALVHQALASEVGQSPYANLATFARALAHIEMSYVGSVDQDALIHGAIRGMVRTLDPHSDYLTPEEYRILASDTQGRFGGIGVEIDVRDGWLTVSAVFPDGPAQRAGLRVGDKFVSIDGLHARDMPIGEAVRRMRGEPGTEVQTTLRRADNAPAIEVRMRREIIAVDAVEGELLPDLFLYVRMHVFQETTARELQDVVDRAEVTARPSGGLRGMVLDLRDNPGGLLDQAVLVADAFLSEGVIVSTRGRGDRELSTVHARKAGTRSDFPMVVLVNGYTASAAEIVAAALHDHGRAVIVGTRTFGKGSVQNVIELPDGSALKLTIARYYSPSGRSIQAQGIDPDVVIEQVADAGARAAAPGVSEASLEGHLENDAVTAPASTVNGRTEHRREAAAPGAPYARDFQARMAYQTLRAISADRQRGPK